MTNKLKREDFAVGRQFQITHSKEIVEIDRVMDNLVVIHYPEENMDPIHCYAAIVTIGDLLETVEPIPQKVTSRRIMKARRSESMIEVKLVSYGHALIVNVNDKYEPDPGTERIVREDSLIKSYKPVDINR